MAVRRVFYICNHLHCWPVDYGEGTEFDDVRTCPECGQESELLISGSALHHGSGSLLIVVKAIFLMVKRISGREVKGE